MRRKHPAGEILEWIILLLIIFAVILEFAELLPGDIIYITAIVSITTICYIFYTISVTNLFFGKKIKKLDFILVLSFLLISSKTFLQIFSEALEKTSFLFDFLSFIVENALLIEFIAIYLGSISLIFISIYIADKITIKPKSVLGFIRESGSVKKLWRVISRALVIFILLLTFYIVVFNLLLEWLIIAADNLIVLFAIIFYIFFVVRHSKRFRPTSIVFKVGGLGETIYSRFIGLFFKKETFYLGVAGLLMIHLIADAGVFLFPYLTGSSSIYISILGEAGHTPIFTLLFNDLIGVSFINAFSLIWIYFFNALAMLMFLVGPFLLWYGSYSKKSIKVHTVSLTAFFVSLTCFILAPLFSISSIRVSGLAGVDIQTVSVIISSVLPIHVIMLISVFVGIFVSVLCMFDWIKRRLLHLALLSLGIFLIVYIYHYVLSLWPYFIESIIILISSPHVFIAVLLFCFFAISILFYPVAFILFVKEIVKKFI